jgi:GLPGLI family protein
MKTKARYFIAALFIFSWAQTMGQLSGIATYQVQIDRQFHMDNAKLSPEAREQLQQQLKRQLQKEFELKFDQANASWKEIPSLNEGPAEATAGEMRVRIMTGGENALLYKNVQKGVMEENRELMGKLFLIKDDLPHYEWQLTGETKQIGHYTCQRAVYLMETEERVFSSESKSLETVKKTVEVEAWYTPEIPVSHGPERYWGLPGLIMELSTDNRRITCSKILLDPQEKVAVDRPKKGKIVDVATYNAIEGEKMEEMTNKYRGRSGGNIQIRTGG